MTYKTASPACAKCGESASADAAWGPIVFYENRQFYDYDYGGCIANVTGDFSDAGCGADKPYETFSVTTPSGTKQYTDSFYGCRGGSDIYVDDIGSVFDALRTASGN